MKIQNSQMAQRKLRQVMNLKMEEFWVIALSADKKVLKEQCLFRGTIDTRLIHPRDIFRFASLAKAHCLIVAHSHPFGEAFPSEDDLVLTEKLVIVSEQFQIQILDHVILTKTSYFSFLDHGLIEPELFGAERRAIRDLSCSE